MKKCKNEKFISTLGEEKLNNKVEVDFDVQRNLPDCQKLIAKKYVSTTAEPARFDRFRIPMNQFECMRNDCVNSGTLFNGGAETIYKFKLDATEFAAGVLTFYVKPPAAASATAVVKFSDSQLFTNADSYTIDLKDLITAEDGYKAVIVDLTKTATQVGTGWSGEGEAIYVSIEITGATSSEQVGISTISFFESMDDFDISTHVIARCLTGTDGSWDLDVAEATCFKNGQFDVSELSGFEKTVSYKAITSNFWRLNPMYNKGKLTKGWDKEVVEVQVKALENTDFGYVTLDDIDQNECGFITVQALYDCRESQNIADAMLERLSIPNAVDMDEDHYQLIDNGDSTTTILFNATHIGNTVLISYPKVVDVDHSFEITDENVNELRTRMTYTKCWTDGERYRFVFDNVLITSFPDAHSEDEFEGELTVNIQRDKNGRFGYAYRIVA